MSRPGALFSWLRNWSREERRGTVTAIYVAAGSGEPVHALDEVRALAGRGLEGDRYAVGEGHWRATDACQVTLVAAEDVARAERASGLTWSRGEHRRNLVVSGVPPAAYRRREVRIGEALLRFHRLRPPCGYLERLVGTGAMKALRGRGGIGLEVVESGTIRVGDAVEVLDRRGES